MKIKDTFRKRFILMLVVLFTCLQKNVAQQNIHPINYQINLNTVNVFNNGIWGNTVIKTVSDSIGNKLTINLLGFTIDSILVNNTLATHTRIETNITINHSFIKGDTSVIEVHYHGIPQTDEQWGGFYVNGTYAFNMGVGFASNPHNFGKAWFPCFDNFTNRATYNFNVTTLPDYTAVCSGLLINDSVNNDGNHVWQWQLNQPIPTYLAGMAIGKYTFLKEEFTGQRGSLPVWLAAEPKDTANLKLSFARLNNAISCFEQKFGPFMFDRVGYVAVPFNSGAMEHASNIAYPIYAINGNSTYETLMAHELSHHWWGNLATCRTAEDMWLNEGWASYCEALFLECAYGKNALIEDLREKQIEVLLNAPKNDDGYRAVSGIPTEFTYGTHVYKKGALMAHLLRNYMGDSLFFAATKNYLSKHQFIDVSSQDLMTEFQQFTSVNLTQLFNQFIYTKGHYDVVVGKSSLDTNTNYLTLNLYTLNRYKNTAPPTFRVGATVYFTDGTSTQQEATITDNYGVIQVSVPTGKVYSHTNIDENCDYALAHTTEQITVKSKGAKSMPNQLFSINTQAITDSVMFNVQHHWVSPTQGNLRQQGIRISTERYWSVRGNIPSTFNAWAFFTYDGTATAHQDEELFTFTNTEDSLVFLYRENENQNWTVLTVSEMTYQPGGNPTDKLGRFWLTRLKSGDYAFGVRNKNVVGLTSTKEDTTPTLWPNPAADELNIGLPNKQVFKQATLEVYNQAGMLIKTRLVNTNQNNTSLVVKDLPAGAYQLIIKLPAKTLTGKFVKY